MKRVLGQENQKDLTIIFLTKMIELHKKKRQIFLNAPLFDLNK